MRENRTYRLSGGRRRALRWAPPPTRHRRSGGIEPTRPRGGKGAPAGGTVGGKDGQHTEVGSRLHVTTTDSRTGQTSLRDGGGHRPAFWTSGYATARSEAVCRGAGCGRTRTSGSVGGQGQQRPWSTRPQSPNKSWVASTGNRQAMICFDPTSLLKVDIDTDWAMVGAPFVGPDKGLVYAPHRSRRCEDVVDPPSDVPLARAAPLPPPRVLARLLGMQGAKGIYPARVDPAVEFGPLLREEPAVRDIRLRARQVNHAVRRVVVADHEHRAPPPQRLRSGEDRPRGPRSRTSSSWPPFAPTSPGRRSRARAIGRCTRGCGSWTGSASPGPGSCA